VQARALQYSQRPCQCLSHPSGGTEVPTDFDSERMHAAGLDARSLVIAHNFLSQHCVTITRGRRQVTSVLMPKTENLVVFLAAMGRKQSGIGNLVGGRGRQYDQGLLHF